MAGIMSLIIFALPLHDIYIYTAFLRENQEGTSADLFMYYNPNTQQWVFKRQQSLGKESSTKLVWPSMLYYLIPEILAFMIPVHQKHHKWNSSACSFAAIFSVL